MQNVPTKEFSEIEYNAQRMNDVEIPLFRLEQRVEKLELQHQNIPLTLAEPIAEEVANKFNKGLAGYLPQVARMLTNFNAFKESTQAKLGELQMPLQESGGSVDMDLFKQLQFKVNNFANEIGFMKKTFSIQKLQQLEAMETSLKNLVDESALMSLELENKAARQDLELFEEKLKGFAPKHALNEMKDDLDRMVKEEDIRILSDEVKKVRTGFDQVILKKELRDRLEAFSKDVNERISDRPTMNYLKRTLQQQDEKLEKFNASLTESMEFQLQEIQDNGKEMIAFGHKLDEIEAELMIKINKDEGAKIWEHFQRFAEYDDLKDLYSKVLPPIAKFEQKLINYYHDNAKTELIVRRFDQVIAEKASKNQVEQIYDHIKQECAPKGGQDGFIGRIEAKIAAMEAGLEQRNQMVELMNQNQTKVLTAEVAKQTAHLKKSAFEDAGDNMGGGAMSEAMKNIIHNKVDKLDLEEIKNTKSSKTDTEMAMRQIEILHRQLRQLSLLITQKFRSSIDRDGQETAHTKTNKKVALLHQALLISQWVSSFDPSSVNDCFDSKHLQVPASLAQYETRIHNDIKRIDDMKLSPNRTHTNDQLRMASNSIIGQLGITGLFKQSRLSKNAGVSPQQTTKDKLDVALDPPQFPDDLAQLSSKQMLKVQRPRIIPKFESLMSKSHERSASTVLPGMTQKSRLIVGNAYQGGPSPARRSGVAVGLDESRASRGQPFRNHDRVTTKMLMTVDHRNDNSGFMSKNYKDAEISHGDLSHFDTMPMKAHQTVGQGGFGHKQSTVSTLDKLKTSEITGTYLPGIYY